MEVDKSVLKCNEPHTHMHYSEKQQEVTPAASAQHICSG